MDLCSPWRVSKFPSTPLCKFHRTMLNGMLTCGVPPSPATYHLVCPLLRKRPVSSCLLESKRLSKTTTFFFLSYIGTVAEETLSSQLVCIWTCEMLLPSGGGGAAAGTAKMALGNTCGLPRSLWTTHCLLLLLL